MSAWPGPDPCFFFFLIDHLMPWEKRPCIYVLWNYRESADRVFQLRSVGYPSTEKHGPCSNRRMGNAVGDMGQSIMPRSARRQDHGTPNLFPVGRLDRRDTQALSRVAGEKKEKGISCQTRNRKLALYYHYCSAPERGRRPLAAT